MRSKEIAPLLQIEPNSVDVLLKRAGERTAVRDRKRLAAMFRRHDPHAYQSTYQRLVQERKPLDGEHLPQPTVDAGSPPMETNTAKRWPLPTVDRQWNDLPTWQRRVWVLAIAVGSMAAAALLLTLSRHVLTWSATQS